MMCKCGHSLEYHSEALPSCCALCTCSYYCEAEGSIPLKRAGVESHVGGACYSVTEARKYTRYEAPTLDGLMQLIRRHDKYVQRSQREAQEEDEG